MFKEYLGGTRKYNIDIDTKIKAIKSKNTIKV